MKINESLRAYFCMCFVNLSPRARNNNKHFKSLQLVLICALQMVLMLRNKNIEMNEAMIFVFTVKSISARYGIRFNRIAEDLLPWRFSLVVMNFKRRIGRTVSISIHAEYALHKEVLHNVGSLSYERRGITCTFIAGLLIRGDHVRSSTCKTRSTRCR
jgi:hypothetical protein